MTESKTMIKVGADGIQLQDFNSMQRFCAAAVESRMFNGVSDVSQAIMKVEYGMELGVKPITAMRNIYYFQGGFCLSAALINALIKRAGYTFEAIERSNDQCVLKFQSPSGKVVGNSEFTWKDAIKKKLTTKKNWVEHPKNMLFARALTQGANMYCAEVFLGSVLTPEEMIESNTTSYSMPPEAPPLEVLIQEAETVDDDDDGDPTEEPASSPIVEVLTPKKPTEEDQKKNGKNGAAVPSPVKPTSSTAIMKNFLSACSSCITLDELDETWDCWEGILDELPRGKDNCQAHWLVLVSKFTGNDVSEEIQSSADKLKPLMAN